MHVVLNTNFLEKEKLYVHCENNISFSFFFFFLPVVLLSFFFCKITDRTKDAKV